jgi:endonuclease YncB( thermonuclease family)
MMLRALLILAVIGFLSPSSYAAYSGPYSLIAPVAIDGDTIRADVTVWPGITADASIRVIGVDSPELTSAGCTTKQENDEIKAAGLAAKQFTEGWLNRNHPVVIGNVKMDAYAGRYDAIVTGATGERLSAALIQSGHGRAYNGGKRQTWCK